MVKKHDDIVNTDLSQRDLDRIGIAINTNAKYYLTNNELLPAVLEARSQGKLTDKLSRMLMLLADRYSRKSNFAGYSFREDMVSAAVINLVQNALKFNPEKSSNPFAFYTTAIHRSFLQYMAEEKKQRYIRDQLLFDSGHDASYTFMEGGKNSDDIVYAGEDKTPTSNPYKKRIELAKGKKEAKPKKAKKETVSKKKKEVVVV